MWLSKRAKPKNTKTQGEKMSAQPKKWEEYTHEERKESFNNYAKYNIIQAIKSKSAPWLEAKNAKELQHTRPFNAQTGRPYEGLNAILLESKQKELGYENGSWITAKQANFLGAKLTGEQLKQMQGVKISYIKTKEATKVLDKKGNPKTKPQVDKNGNTKINPKTNKPYYDFVYDIKDIKTKEATKVLDKKGNPKTKPQVDKNGNTKINPKTNKPYYDFVYDIKELPAPILETTTLYHTSQIPSLDKSRLKELDLSLNEPKDITTNYLKGIGLTEHTQKQISNYLQAQAGLEHKSRLKELDLSLNEPKDITTNYLKGIGLTEHTQKQISNYLQAQAGLERYRPLPKPQLDISQNKNQENTMQR